MAARGAPGSDRPAADGRGGDQSAVAAWRATALRSLTVRGGLVRSRQTWRSTPMKKLVLETTAPFQGLPELVAYDEGLFAAEGLDVVFVKRGEKAPVQVDRSITNAVEVSPFGSHGSSLETGKAAMFNACEWGNYCRVENS